MAIFVKRWNWILNIESGSKYAAQKKKSYIFHPYIQIYAFSNGPFFNFDISIRESYRELFKNRDFFLIIATNES